MPDKNTKEFTIKINGLEQSIKYSKLLLDNFDKLGESVKTLNVGLDKSAQKIKETISILGKDVESISEKQVIKVEELVTKTGAISSKLIKVYQKEILNNLIPEDGLKKKIESVATDIPKTIKPHIDQTQKDLKEAFEESEKRSKGFFKRTGYFFKDLYKDVRSDWKNLQSVGKDLFKMISGLKIKEVKKEEKKEETTKDSSSTKASTESKESKTESNGSVSTAKKKEEPQYKSQREKDIAAWKEHWGEIAKTAETYSKAIGQVSSGMFDLLSSQIESKKKEAEKNLKETTEKYDKIVEARKESDNKIAEIHNKSVNLSGGRSLAMQKQMDEEMAKREQLVAEEKRLEAEKEKAKKEVEKQESRSKRVAAQKQFVQGTIDVTSGVLKAWALGPIVGPIMAAIVAAAGAVQLVKMAKEIKKMADGGLLHGRRHSDGGMRIEGTNIEVEGGEYVINRRTTDHNLGLIRYINSQRRPLGESDLHSFFRSPQQVHVPAWRRQMENGGMMPVVEQPSMSTDNVQLIDAIRNIRIDSRVAVTDIIRAQDQMTAVDSWVGM